MLHMKGIIKTRRYFIIQSAMAAGALTLMNACGKRFTVFKSSFDPDAITKFGKSFSGHIIIHRTFSRYIKPKIFWSP